MKTSRVAVVGLLVWGLFVSMTPSAHPQQLQQPRRVGRCVLNIAGTLKNAVTAACSEIGDEQCALLAVDSTDLGSDLTHYEIEIQVGSHMYDRVVLHRVVSELWSGLPRNGRHSIMLLPSHYFDWEHFFLPPSCPEVATDNLCAAASLAERGIDVWGLDMRARSLPSDIQDFSFMENWDLNAYMDDTRLALATAQRVRSMTVRQPSSNMHLLGFGRSVWLAYALANRETQLPVSSRLVAGMIPVDQGFRYGPDGSMARQLDCDSEDSLRASMERGVFARSHHLISVGELAISDPNGQSPHESEYTNRDYALLIGAATYMGDAPVPHYHLTAGELDDDGLPIRLIYTDEQRWFGTMAAAMNHLCVPYFLDTMTIACGEADVPFDDHLSEITIPVFYIGAAGGYGELGIYSTTLLGSSDVTSLIVQLQTPENAVLDFGHGDIWFSATAKTEVWEPLADWLEAH